MISKKANKQITKPKTNNRSRQCNKQICICIIPIEDKEKSLMKFAALSTKSQKTEKCLSKIIFDKDLMDQCLLDCMFLSCHVCVSEWIHTM